MYKKFKSAKFKRGFTLIELIVVIAVIAVLVLLAVPKFMGHIDKAKEAHIVNDVRVAENKVSEFLIGHGHEIGDISSREVAYSDLYKVISDEDGKVFSREGEVDSIMSGTYSQLLDEFIREDVRSKLNGQFFTDDDGNVYYSDVPVESNLNDYVKAEDKDFVFIADEWAPFAYDGVYGSYQYIGSHEFVIIPKVIHGHVVKDYYKMFAEYESEYLKGVASEDDSSIISTYRMFYNANVPNYNLDISHFTLLNAEDFTNMFSGTTLKSVNLSGFKSSKLKTIASMFYQAKILTDVKMHDVELTGIERFTDIFFYGESLGDISIKSITLENEGHPLSFNQLFYSWSANSINIDDFTINNAYEATRLVADVNLDEDLTVSNINILMSDLNEFPEDYWFGTNQLISQVAANNVIIDGVTINNAVNTKQLFYSGSGVVEDEYSINNLNIHYAVDAYKVNEDRNGFMLEMFESLTAKKISVNNVFIENATHLNSLFDRVVADDFNVNNLDIIMHENYSENTSRAIFDDLNVINAKISNISIKDAKNIESMFDYANVQNLLDIENVNVLMKENADKNNAGALFNGVKANVINIDGFDVVMSSLSNDNNASRIFDYIQTNDLNINNMSIENSTNLERMFGLNELLEIDIRGLAIPSHRLYLGEFIETDYSGIFEGAEGRDNSKNIKIIVNSTEESLRYRSSFKESIPDNLEFIVN